MSITLITGASRGVGEALAWKLAGEGHSVAALARSGDKLQELAGRAQEEGLPGTIIACPVDLRDPAAVATVVCQPIKKLYFSRLIRNGVVKVQLSFPT